MFGCVHCMSNNNTFLLTLLEQLVIFYWASYNLAPTTNLVF